MSTTVTSREQVERLPAGGVLLIQRGNEINEWVKDEEGMLTYDGAALGPDKFDAAISNRTAFLAADHPVGSWLANEAKAQYMLVLDVAHGVYTTAFFDSNARLQRIAEEPPLGAAWNPVATMVTTSEVVWHAVTDRVARERLEKILDTGTIPESRPMQVTVRARGTSTVTPTETDAVKILGTDVKVTAVQPIEVEWTKEFPVEVTSRWDCACREVTPDAVQALLPPGTNTWIPVTCAASKRK